MKIIPPYPKDEAIPVEGDIPHPVLVPGWQKGGDKIVLHYSLLSMMYETQIPEYSMGHGPHFCHTV